MNAPRSAPQRAVPILTEVVEPAAPSKGGEEGTAAGAQDSQEKIVQGVLADLQRQIDLMLEHRLRETLAPALARMSDALIHELRDDLAVTLRDIVTRAVAQELLRQRGHETPR